jgi:phage shock protein PspC (stress-responsive transcriptional regulator)
VHRLYRHPTDKVIGGVAAGLGVWMNIDPTFVRLAWVLLAIFTGGVFMVIYIAMLFVVPLPPQGWMPGPRPGGPVPGQPAPGQPPGSTTPPGAWAAWQPPPGAGPGPTPGGSSDPAPPGSGGWQQSPPPSGGWAPPAIGNGNAGIVGGVILVLLGAWFLVDQYVDIDWSLLWPVLLMLAGVGLIVLAARRGRTPG